YLQPGLERGDRQGRRHQQVVPLVKTAHENADPHAYRGRVQVIHGRQATTLRADLPQPPVQFGPPALRELFDRLGGSAEPQHMERFDRIVEARIDLVDLGAEIGQHTDGRAYPRLHLAVDFDVTE